MDEGLKKATSMISSTKEKPKLGGAAEPFIAIFKGFGEIFGAFGLKDLKFGSGKKKVDEYKTKKSIDTAKKEGKNAAWLAFKNYKKAHKMITW